MAKIPFDIVKMIKEKPTLKLSANELQEYLTDTFPTGESILIDSTASEHYTIYTKTSDGEITINYYETKDNLKCSIVKPICQVVVDIWSAVANYLSLQYCYLYGGYVFGDKDE